MVYLPNIQVAARRHRACGWLALGAALALLAGCARPPASSPATSDGSAATPAATAAVPGEAATVQCFATITDIRPEQAPTKKGELPSGPCRIKLLVHQTYLGELATGALTCTVDDVQQTLPADDLAPEAKGEAVILATCVRTATGWRLQSARAPDVVRWRCWVCGRDLQAWRFDGKAYTEERYFCPVHGHRDTRLEEKKD